MNKSKPAIRIIGIPFLVIQGLAILTCFTLIIYAIIRSNEAGGDDDTLGVFVTGFLLISLYLTGFWIFNYKLLKGNYKSELLKLGVIFIFSIIPISLGLFLILTD